MSCIKCVYLLGTIEVSTKSRLRLYYSSVLLSEKEKYTIGIKINNYGGVLFINIIFF